MSINQACSVVVPVFNEAPTVEKLLQAVVAQSLVGEVIVVDDASTDGTWEILQSLVPISPLPLWMERHGRNRGKGAALRTGFALATRPYVVIQDADLEYDPAVYPHLVQPLLEGRADVVYGSRFLGGSAHRVLYFWHRMGNGLLTLLSNMCTNLNLTDMETGCKAFRRDLLQKIVLREERFGFEPEITAKLARREARFYEVGVHYAGRTYAEGKKVGWRDGFRALWCIAKYSWWD